MSLNDLIRAQNDGGLSLYNGMGTVAIAAMVLTLIFYLVRAKASLLLAAKGVVIAAVGYECVVYGQYLLMWYRVSFRATEYFQTANLALGFILLPVVAWLTARLLRVSDDFAGDVLALTLLGYHVIGRSGCIFSGCCYGFPCDWGLYSFETGQNQFPVCIVESAYTLTILVFILVRICRKGYTPDGKNLPYFLLLYGVCRFFSEMTRESTRDWWLFWRISDVHFHMLVMAAVGGLLLWHRVKKESLDRVGEGVPLPALKRRRR